MELLRGSGKSQMQLAKELGVAESSLYKWSRQYDSGVFTQVHRKPLMIPVKDEFKNLQRY